MRALCRYLDILLMFYFKRKLTYGHNEIHYLASNIFAQWLERLSQWNFLDRSNKIEYIYKIWYWILQTLLERGKSKIVLNKKPTIFNFLKIQTYFYETLVPWSCNGTQFYCSEPNNLPEIVFLTIVTALCFSENPYV